jgi:lipoprotein-anchoring transpeptidase ErfK/SrfK
VWRRAIVGSVVVLTLIGCGGGRSERRSQPPLPTSTSATPTTADPNVSLVARALVPSLGVFNEPEQTEPAQVLGNPRPSADLNLTAPLVLLVVEEQENWLKVLLPVRPNGSTGWIRRADVGVETHQFRILVELGAHRITVWRGNEVFLQEPVGVGTAATQTPGGLFYTTELLPTVGQPQYGPYAFALSGYSEVHHQFAGGQGVLGIHGTNTPSALGKDVSNGCIRMSNAGITRLAETLPVGVPVEIRS